MEVRRTTSLVAVVVLLLTQGASISAAQVSTSASAGGANYASCLVEVPYNATITYKGEGSGDEVKFANGTTVSFPLTSCVRAVYRDLYSIVLNITANPQFVAAENGTMFGIEEYSYSGNFFYTTSHTCTTTSRSGVGIVSPPECLVSTIVVFDTWSNETRSCCGYPVSPTQTGEIDVSIPFNATGSQSLPT